MEKPKKYNIETLQDIIDCTNESNLDDFLTDLKSFLKMAHSIRELNTSLSGEDAPFEGKMKWIDDGKNECHGITIKPIKE